MVAAVSPDGARLATGSQDRTVRLWDLESGSLVRASDEHRDIRSLVFSPDGQLLATTAPEPDRRIGLIPVKGSSLLHTLVGHRQQVTHVVFFPDGKRLASASADRSVRLWSTDSGREMRGFPDFPSPVLALAVTPDGRRLAAACEDRSVSFLVLESGRPIPVFQGPRHARALVFSADGAVLAAAGDDGCVWVWQADRPVRILEGHIAAVRELAFSPDRRLLASGSDDNTIRLWDTQTWECLAVLAPLREGWAAFRPDGRFRTSRTTGGGFWHVVGLCRFEPGELAVHAPRLALESGEPLLNPSRRRSA
jgi:WD40 repeat protein